MLENFEQASSDYEAALNLLKHLLPPYSRRLSDAHLRLGLALEFHPDVERRKQTKEHIECAANVLRRRLIELEHVSKNDKDKPADDVANDLLWQLDNDQLRREKKDIEELLMDLNVKVRISLFTPAR